MTTNPPPVTAPRTILSRLSRVIEHVSHLLPAQGPITVFIHHNTLHAFEHLPFSDAVKEAARVFGCQPYLTEDQYRADLGRGRIRFDELREVLNRDLGAGALGSIPPFGSRLDLRLAMLQYPLRSGPTEELLWYVAERDALRRIRFEASSASRDRSIAETRRWVMRDLRGGQDRSQGGGARAGAGRALFADLVELFKRFGESNIENWTDDDWEGFTLQALWRVCCDGVRDLPHYTTPPSVPVRHRDLLLDVTGADADLLVNDLLIRFCASFLDQGFARWNMPRREEGFYAAFFALYDYNMGPPQRWTGALAEEIQRLQRDGIRPLESILESLRMLGIEEIEWETYLAATLLSLRGWAGMLHQVELRGDRAVQSAPAGSLVEFIAVRLLLDRLAVAHTASEALGFTGSLDTLRARLLKDFDPNWPPSVEQRAFSIFQLAQVQGLSPDVLYRLSHNDWATLVAEIELFSGIERRRIFHLAYELRLKTQTLDAIALHAPSSPAALEAPRLQVVCCLDEREESFRRHMEEIEPNIETFGVAGFYSVAMYYRGAADAHYVPLCPVVVRPQHWVSEEVQDDHGRTHRRRARTRRALGTASHQFHLGTRNVAFGAILSSVFGVLATFPLVARILFPRITARIRQLFGRIVQTPQGTLLRLERRDATPGPDNGQVGFTIDEMTDLGERLLRDIGLTTGFGRLVILLGHGSNSLNNPHNSAYNCGACGGSAGGPNARAMAQILNDPRVRQGLVRRGLRLSAETVFLGGQHNTCSDTVAFFDTARIPASHQQDIDAARQIIDESCERNAHERCRRFMSAPLTLSFGTARQHVDERAEDLAQTRPELGHATNAVTIIGRREWTRGLFLDRRAFLTSYDPLQDDSEHSILTRILQAVFPVCAGINLEYYFSKVDNPGFGCGTKLPHNLSALLGVMDGAASDLRTGLPWQMVEIHEPVRSLFLIDTTPEAMTRIMERNAMIGRLCQNGWVQLAVVHPLTRKISVFRDGIFRPYEPQAAVLPTAASSADWYRGWRDHLEFAEIRQGIS